MNDKLKWILIVLAVVGLSAGIYFAFSDKQEAVLIMEEVAEIEEIFNTAKQKEATDFDLEETIRIIHGLDKAKSEADNFNEFFEYMKTQDYSQVASDVIEAKSKLLPILNELRLAEKELEDAGELWKTFAGISEVVVDEASDLAITAAITGFSPIMAPDFVDIGKQSFAVLKEQEELKKEIKNKISSIREDYLSYLDEFAPVYLKYMREWDRLCLIRDNAYLEIHQGNVEAALISLEEVLKINPTDKEGQILKSFCLLMKQQSTPQLLDTNEVVYNYADEAKEILDNYIENHPDRSAPALLLLGTYNWLRGDVNKAITLFDQSAIEYPRQSEALLDMLNSYKQRSYLRKTAEGMYIVELYKSTMEGFSFFSPNFQKALIASNEGDFSTAKDEIINHFFRRGNQGVYDYMISDMVHCETYLPESFNMIFKEKSFLDLDASSAMWSSEKMDIKIKNRSDVKLSNVRVFLCLHFTDMHKDDYEVFKVQTTVNNIEPHSVADFGTSEIHFELYGKDKNLEEDIVTARAIVVTDDIITWVDQDKFKFTKIKDSYDHYSEKKSSVTELNKYYNSFGLDGQKIMDLIQSEAKIETEHSYFGKDVIKVKLPRVLVHLNPYFSINELDMEEAILPSSVKLNGPTIDIELKENAPKEGKIEFYLSSEKIKIRWDIFYDQDGQVENVSAYLI